MFQSQIHDRFIAMEKNQHVLPPLSQITSALPFPHQHPSLQQQQQQQHQHHQQQHFHHQPLPHFQQPPVQQQQVSYQPPYGVMNVPQYPVHKQLEDTAAKKSPPLSPKYTAKQPMDRCTCKHDGNHIPRPRNAFILFRQQHHQSVLDEGNVIKTNPDVSRELGKRWRDLSLQEKDYWNSLAEEEKKKHAEKYPGYRYIPRRFGKKGGCPYCKSKQSAKAAVGSASSSNSPESGHASLNPDPKFNPASEEHAIAQSFLNLRNQPQHYPNSHLQPTQAPPPHYTNSQAYASQPPQPHQQVPLALASDYQRHQAALTSQPHQPLPVPTVVKQEEASEFSPKQSSPSYKVGSIASFLN